MLRVNLDRIDQFSVDLMRFKDKEQIDDIVSSQLSLPLFLRLTFSCSHGKCVYPSVEAVLPVATGTIDPSVMETSFSNHVDRSEYFFSCNNVEDN